MIQSTMSKIKAQHSTGSMRQSSYREDVPPPFSVTEPSSSCPVVTTDAQIATLIQQMKVLMEAIQSLQQQQIQQQQQPSVEEPVAHFVPCRHSHRPLRCSPSSSPERRSSRHSHPDGQLYSRHSHHVTHHSRCSLSPSRAHSIRKEK